MTIDMNVTNEIDHKNNLFTSNVKHRLKNLNEFTDDALDFLMKEHYQFSSRNTGFLATAVDTTKQFQEQGVSVELQRNFNEEKNHAAIYKKALFEIGTDVESRDEFMPTTIFFDTISTLICTCPSCTLGAMYATETAAIFEHEVFHAISHEIITRRNKEWEKSRLKLFHDMHLSGVEQGHKDGLGMFVDLSSDDVTVQAQPTGQFIQRNQVIIGANQAIDAMVIWWNALLKQAEHIK